MKKAKLFISVLTVLLLTAVLFQQCREDELDWNNDGTPYIYSTHLIGTVVDEQQEPLVNATVTCLDFTTTTDENGFFQFAKAYVVKGRTQVQVESGGYFNSFYAVHTQKAHTTIKVVMSEKQTQSIMPSVDSKVVFNEGKASVDLPSEGYVYSQDGTSYDASNLTVDYKHYNPEDPFFSLQMPGGDFMGLNEAGEEQLLKSFGAVSVELTDNSGNEIQLGNGQMATIRLEVPNDLLADAPPTIPLWYFDEEKAIWVEEGVGTLIGTEYVGEVSHFSAWNFDIPGEPRARVNGYVVDCNAQPIPNVDIQVGPRLIRADEKGYYDARVAVNDDFSVYVPEQYNWDMASQIINVSPLQRDEERKLENLVLPCPTRIEGVVHNCRGELIPASILIKWSSGRNLAYSKDGNFSVRVGGTLNEVVEVSIITTDLLKGDASATIPEYGMSFTLEEPVIACNELDTGCPSVVCVVNEAPFTFVGETHRYGDILEQTQDPYFEDILYRELSYKVISMGTATESFHIFLPKVEVGIYKINSLYDGASAMIGHVVDGQKDVDFLKLNGQLTIQEVGPDYISGYFYGRRVSFTGEHVVKNGSFCIPYK